MIAGPANQGLSWVESVLGGALMSAWIGGQGSGYRCG